jgi:hypothetical protein
MASRLRNKTARVSFFAFQDMITTVTGVLMIVMLLLLLDVGQRTSRPSEAARNTARDQVQEAQRKLAASAEALRQRQAELKVLANRVFVLPEADRSGKQPVLIVLSGTNGWCSRLAQTNLLEFSGDARRTDFNKLLAGWNARQDRLVFYVRPSGIGHFEVCRSLARKRGFNIGSDAAEEDKQYMLAKP